MDENNELTIYILQQLRQGIPEKAVRDVLAQSGWPQALVDRAFTMILQARPHNLTPSYPNVAPAQTPEAELPAPKDNPRPVLENEKKLEKRGYLRKTLTIIAVLLVLAAIGAGTYWLMNKDNKPAQKASSTNVSLDPKRTKTINGLSDKLIAYYSAKGTYPSFVAITAADFAASPSGFDASKYTDPAWNAKKSACVDSAGNPTFTETRADNCISYRATALNGGDCDGLDKKCTRVVLTVTLDSNKPYIVALDRNSKE
jgi:hypothetical protein